MPRWFFEDFEVGSVATHGPREVTREEIIAFAEEFDPQPFHLDEGAAKASLLGGLAASGWHTCSIGMAMIAEMFILDTAGRGSGGVDEVRWLRPVKPGDRLTLERTITGKRVSRSRPEMGIVDFAFRLLDAEGRPVMTQVNTIMIGRRHPEAA